LFVITEWNNFKNTEKIYMENIEMGGKRHNRAFDVNNLINETESSCSQKKFKWLWKQTHIAQSVPNKMIIENKIILFIIIIGACRFFFYYS